MLGRVTANKASLKAGEKSRFTAIAHDFPDTTMNVDVEFVPTKVLDKDVAALNRVSHDGSSWKTHLNPVFRPADCGSQSGNGRRDALQGPS